MKVPSAVLSLLLTLGLCDTALSGGSYARAGWVADLVTISHNVSGRVTILDAETLLVENFNYDGGGISVFFTLGTSNTNPAFAAGPNIGSDLKGTVFTNDTVVVNVPGGVNLDTYAAISVWCVTAGANFGSASFTAPATPRLILSALPGALTGGGVLTFTHSQGAPGMPVLLFLAAANGIPFTLKLLSGATDGAGEWCLAAPTPALSGVQFEFMTIGFLTPTLLGVSNHATVDFL